MPTKTMSSENKDLRKQIGCMASIFHNFLTGRRISSHNHNKLLLAAQDQQEPQDAARTIIEKDSELLKEKPRTSVESSRVSFSSSCSSTIPPHDSHRTAQPEKNTSRQSPNQMNTIKEEAQQTHDFRALVKDSMHRETRGLSIKSITNGERRSQPMRHVDSPRPLKQKSNINEGSTRVLVKDERLALPRFSYDGRESRETWKSKLKELPRLSLDSKSSSIKSSESNFLRRDPRMENENLNQEPGSQPRSSVVAKLMGLDSFPETVSTPKINSCVEEAILTRHSIPSEKSLKTQGNDVSSPSPRLNKANSVKKLSQLTKLATFPTEPAPWRLKDSKNKVPQNVQPLSSSVYGEIEKRITELEFRKSGKDLRALKQILDAMQKTRERMESQTIESAEFVLQRRPSPQTKLGSSIVIMKPAKVQVTSSTKLPVPATEIHNLQKVRIWNHGGDSVREVKDVAPRKYNLKNQSQHLPPTEKKNLSRNSELQRTLRSSQRVNVENCSITVRNIGALSPRPQRSDLERVKRHPSRKPEENGSQRRKLKVKARDSNTSYEQVSEPSSDTRYSSYQSDTVSIKSESNYSLASQMETEASSNQREQNYLSMSKEDITSVDLVVSVTEQPSPVSVLNGAFYNEDSPSPVKKMSTVFQDDTPSPDETEWHLENPNSLMPCKRLYNGYEFNHKLDYMKNLLNEFTLVNTKPDKTAATQNEERHGQDHSYINTIFQSLGLLKDGSFLEEGDKEHNWKDYSKKFNQKRERNLVFDTVNEILCRKIRSASLFTVTRKRTSPHGLLKEIHSEIHDLQTMPVCNDDEDDGFIRLLTADLKHQSEDWADYSNEIPSLVLDIERLIFKDLINEVVTGRYGYH